MYSNNLFLFENESLRKDALNVNIREIEVLYWIVEDALDDGNISRAKNIYEFLCYIAKFNPSAIKNGLQLPQIQRLQQISYQLHGNTILKEEKSISSIKGIPEKNIPFQKEKDLQNYLINNKHVLEEPFKNNLVIYGQEVDVGDGFRCDLVAETSSVLYPIELKIRQTTHSVCSQIDKYCFYFYRKMRYDRFKKIQGVVIGNGYDDWSINEIRKKGHLILEIFPHNGSDIFLKLISTSK